MSERLPVVVASVGNNERGDDGFGPLVTRQLATYCQPGLRVIDLGMDSTALLDILTGVRVLIVVDALSSPEYPVGSLLDFDWFDPDRPSLVSDRSLSTHGLSIADQIDLAGAIHLLPASVRLIGVVVGETAPGGAPGPAVQRAVPLAVERIREWTKTVGER